MAARRYAALTGIAFTLLGLLGFTTAHLFGLFHSHPVHNVIHLAVGVIGLAGAFLEGLAWTYARLTGLLFIVLAVLGVFFPDLFPAMPLGPADDVLHFIVGAIALYIGYVLAYEPAPAKPQRTSRPSTRSRGGGTRGIR